ncbi:MAG TPA: RlmE family RNA methyltransferase [Rhodospirillales bacterium]|nr:RlmE family RNA methyltransferase [Rhodospirillales bacterium]
MSTKKGGGKGGKKGSQAIRFSGRGLTTRVMTAKGRKLSSTRWLQRQLNDPYVAEAKRRGYPSRAAFKLIELDDKFHLLKRSGRVVDLGAAPGGWTQVCVERIGPKGKIVALDINEMAPVPGATVITCDFLEPEAPALLKDALDGPADLVLTDMAAPVTGHAGTDHLRIMGLCEVALDFAEEVLSPGGTFVAKVFQGGAEHGLLSRLKQSFKTVRHAKPPASRAGSAEMYVVAQGFRAGPDR